MVKMAIGVGIGNPAMGGRRRRHIRTWNGSTTYGTFNDSIAFTGGFEIEIVFSVSNTSASYQLIDAPSATNRSVVQLLATTGYVKYDTAVTSATLNGVSIASETTAANLGKINTLVLSGTGPSDWGIIGKTYVDVNPLVGEILSIRFTGATAGGEIDEFYPIDDDSLTTTYAEGHSSPSTKFITWSNFVASDIELFTFNSQTGCWEAAIHADICNP